MADEWGPWIEHDGKGCPVEGLYVRSEAFDGEIWEGIAGSECRKSGHNPSHDAISAWVWLGRPSAGRIIRYRVRKPRGMQILEGILNGLPVLEDA